MTKTVKETIAPPEVSYEVHSDKTPGSVGIKTFYHGTIRGDIKLAGRNVFTTSITFINFTSNCKLGSMENLTGILSKSEYYEKLGITEEMRIELFKEIIKNLPFTAVCLRFDLTNEELLKTLSRAFKLAYCVKLPLGYVGGMQYHGAVYIGTPYTGPGSKNVEPEYRKRLEKEGIELWVEKT